MLMTNTDLAESIITRYTRFLSIAAAAADLTLLAPPISKEEQGSPIINRGELRHIHNCIEQNTMVSVNLNLQFLNNMITRSMEQIIREKRNGNQMLQRPMVLNPISKSGSIGVDAPATQALLRELVKTEIKETANAAKELKKASDPAQIFLRRSLTQLFTRTENPVIIEYPQPSGKGGEAVLLPQVRPREALEKPLQESLPQIKAAPPTPTPSPPSLLHFELPTSPKGEPAVKKMVEKITSETITEKKQHIAESVIQQKKQTLSYEKAITLTEEEKTKPALSPFQPISANLIHPLKEPILAQKTEALLPPKDAPMVQPNVILEKIKPSEKAEASPSATPMALEFPSVPTIHPAPPTSEETVIPTASPAPPVPKVLRQPFLESLQAQKSAAETSNMGQSIKIPPKAPDTKAPKEILPQRDGILKAQPQIEKTKEPLPITPQTPSPVPMTLPQNAVEMPLHGNIAGVQQSHVGANPMEIASMPKAVPYIDSKIKKISAIQSLNPMISQVSQLSEINKAPMLYLDKEPNKAPNKEAPAKHATEESIGAKLSPFHKAIGIYRKQKGGALPSSPQEEFQYQDLAQVSNLEQAPISRVMLEEKTNTVKAKSQKSTQTTETFDEIPTIRTQKKVAWDKQNDSLNPKRAINAPKDEKNTNFNQKPQEVPEAEIARITEQVYRTIESRLRHEKMRRGMW